LLPQLLSQDRVDVAALRVEVTQEHEAARATVLLTTEGSAWEAIVGRDGATLCIKDAEDQVTLAERKVLERVSWAEVRNSAALVLAHDNAEGLAQKITPIESELMEERRASETSKRELWECFNKLTLLQTWGLELCLTILSPPWAERLSEGMQLATLHHNEMVRELAAFRVVVSSTAELVLGRSPNNVAWMKVVGELVVEHPRLEECRSKLERPAAKICSLLISPPPSRAWLTNHL
jgi:hypothetical protein